MKVIRFLLIVLLVPFGSDLGFTMKSRAGCSHASLSHSV